MGRWCRETPTDKIPYDVVGLNATAGFDVSKHRGRHRGPGAVSIASVRFLDSSLSGCPLAAAMVAEVEKSGEAWFGSSNMGWQGFFPAQRFVLANDGRRHQPAYCSSVEIAQGGKDKGRLMKGDAEVRAIVNFRHGRSSNGQMAVRL